MLNIIVDQVLFPKGSWFKSAVKYEPT